jgi:dephospho-CoA kinase
MIVGITGGYCSGKSVASGVMRDLGYEIVEVDRIGHEALEAKVDELVSAFGEGILSGGGTRSRGRTPRGRGGGRNGDRNGRAGGSVDRGRLGGIVFADPEARRKLEAIVHPWMIRRVKEEIRGKRRVVIDAALLIEMCLFTLCDTVLGIEASEETAVGRGMERGGLTREQALLRVRAQIPLKQKLQYVDKVVGNDGDIGAFKKEIREFAESAEKKV